MRVTSENFSKKSTNTHTHTQNTWLQRSNKTNELYDSHIPCIFSKIATCLKFARFRLFMVCVCVVVRSLVFFFSFSFFLFSLSENVCNCSSSAWVQLVWQRQLLLHRCLSLCPHLSVHSHEFDCCLCDIFVFYCFCFVVVLVFIWLVYCLIRTRAPLHLLFVNKWLGLLLVTPQIQPNKKWNETKQFSAIKWHFTIANKRLFDDSRFNFVIFCLCFMCAPRTFIFILSLGHKFITAKRKQPSCHALPQ